MKHSRSSWNRGGAGGGEPPSLLLIILIAILVCLALEFGLGRPVMKTTGYVVGVFWGHFWSLTSNAHDPNNSDGNTSPNYSGPDRFGREHGGVGNG